ncbi:hypothetical protein K449DRAFT_244597 [Hypoxylon sp. EC38]|nr:hypothetical protein K449DRAFT_244597 [Hypoxylon sp. EC38]
MCPSISPTGRMVLSLGRYSLSVHSNQRRGAFLEAESMLLGGVSSILQDVGSLPRIALTPMLALLNGLVGNYASERKRKVEGQGLPTV